jgi:hypothetical protein
MSFHLGLLYVSVLSLLLLIWLLGKLIGLPPSRHVGYPAYPPLTPPVDIGDTSQFPTPWVTPPIVELFEGPRTQRTPTLVFPSSQCEQPIRSTVILVPSTSTNRH